LGQRYRLIHERLSAEAETGSPDSRERLANTERAYTVLNSPALRAQYDAALARGESGVNIGAAPGELPPSPPEFYRVNLPAAPIPNSPRRIKKPSSGGLRRYLIRRVKYMALGLVISLVGGYFVIQHRSAARESDLKSSAKAYAVAILAFEHEHNGTPPLLNSSDWPDRLQGPLNLQRLPYLEKIPKYVQEHPFDLIQTRSRSGFNPSPDSGRIEETSTASQYYLQYVPYGRTYDLQNGGYSYQGYLLLIHVPYLSETTASRSASNSDYAVDTQMVHNCEAWGDPVQASCH